MTAVSQREGGRQCENVDDADRVLEIHKLPARAAEERDTNRLRWLSVTCRGSSVEGASSAGRAHGAGEGEDGRLQPTSRTGGLQEEPTAEGGARERGVRWGLCVLKTVTPPARPRVEPHRRRAGFAACRF